ncbi:hypothetical protein BU24DRAFT_459446 [Aaosphaeria arxii CBS 175.79]|uniref:Uncharacterized protein n=1 Tax=Aaosphaeria arxii CBS 175.79 TaxID=1450172 RepID=A0A6A5Y469_9PLEO|nr:uncharacterized protein BU24DRAFT_459446 [Aaosphaeria arxii CBS 175.79]KAF2019817.1 hypothetical protein BU24DRAFT_459446 [Aaosphaeria arxii CBS 175.79]
MASDTCSYVCGTEKAPGEFEPNPDITGTGVRLSYTITAGLSVFIVCAYYVSTFRPDVSPFHPEGELLHQDDDFQPNPVDTRVLGWTKKLWNLVYKPKAGSMNLGRNKRFKRALVNSMLVMSDLQLLVGLSLVFSGYIQLRCGLTAYHWQQLLHLVWLTSVTHFSCLTFLRGHLQQHPFKRTWRLILMTTLVIALVVGLSSTSYYTFTNTLISWEGENYRPEPSDYAICYMNGAERVVVYDGGKSRQYMIFSNVLIVFGLFVRLVRSYEFPVMFLLHRRQELGDALNQMLRKMAMTCDRHKLLADFAVAFLYIPCASVIVLISTLLDLGVSMLFEVWWLIVCFVWGCIRLWVTGHGGVKDGPQDWSFGQTLPLFLLGAPVFAMLEGFFSSERDSHLNVHLTVQTQAQDQAQSKPSTPAAPSLPPSPTSNPPSIPSTATLPLPVSTSSTTAPSSPKRAATSHIPSSLPRTPDLNIHTAFWVTPYTIILLIWLANLSASTLTALFVSWVVVRVFYPFGFAMGSLYFVIVFSLLVDRVLSRPASSTPSPSPPSPTLPPNSTTTTTQPQQSTAAALSPKRRRALRAITFVINFLMALALQCTVWFEEGRNGIRNGTAYRALLIAYAGVYVLVCFADMAVRKFWGKRKSRGAGVKGG